MSIDPAGWKKKPVGVILSVTYLRAISVTSKRYFLELPSSPPHYQHAPVAPLRNRTVRKLRLVTVPTPTPPPTPKVIKNASVATYGKHRAHLEKSSAGHF